MRKQLLCLGTSRIQLALQFPRWADREELFDIQVSVSLPICHFNMLDLDPQFIALRSWDARSALQTCAGF